MPKNEEVSLSSLGIQMPYNMQAEQSVLGAALMDETVLNRLITDMEPEMFYSDQNRAVYETMRALYTESEAVDVITLVNALANGGTFASADDAKVYITRIAETVPAISNVDSYFKIVKEKYQARRLIDAARGILSETASGEDADLLLESAEQKMTSAPAATRPVSRPSASPFSRSSTRCRSSAVPTAISSPAFRRALTIWIPC